MLYQFNDLSLSNVQIIDLINRAGLGGDEVPETAEIVVVDEFLHIKWQVDSEVEPKS